MFEPKRKMLVGIELWQCIDSDTGEESLTFTSQEKAQEHCDRVNSSSLKSSTEALQQ